MLNVNVLYLVCEHGQIQFTVIFTFSDEGSVRFRKFRRTVSFGPNGLAGRLEGRRAWKRKDAGPFMEPTPERVLKPKPGLKMRAGTNLLQGFRKNHSSSES